MSIEAIIFYLLLLDSLGANWEAWFDGKGYRKHFPVLSKYFPATKGWAFYYLVLVLWIGMLLHQLGII